MLHWQTQRLQELPLLTKEEAPVTTKECPACLSTIPLKATRCPACTTHLEVQAEA